MGRIFLNLILVYIILFIGIWLNPVQIYGVSLFFFILLVCLLIYFLCIIVWLVSEVLTVNMLNIVFQKKRVSIRFRLGPAKTVFFLVFLFEYILLVCLFTFVALMLSWYLKLTMLSYFFVEDDFFKYYLDIINTSYKGYIKSNSKLSLFDCLFAKRIFIFFVYIVYIDY